MKSKAIKFRQRLVFQGPPPIRFWFNQQPNGKITCAQYVGNPPERIDIIQPFEPSMWNLKLNDIRLRMVVEGWPRREVKFFYDERNQLVTTIVQALLTKCKQYKVQLVKK